MCFLSASRRQVSDQVEFSSKSFGENLQDTKKNHVLSCSKLWDVLGL